LFAENEPIYSCDLAENNLVKKFPEVMQKYRYFNGRKNFRSCCGKQVKTASHEQPDSESYINMQFERFNQDTQTYSNKTLCVYA